MANLLKIECIERDWQNATDQCVSVGIYNNLQLNRQLQGVNRKLGRAISHALSAKIIKGKIGEVTRLVGKKGLVAYVYGMGEKGSMNPESFRISAAAVSKYCIKDKLKSVTFLMPSEGKDSASSQATAEGIVLGSYQFYEFKSNLEEITTLDSATIVGGNKESIEKGVIIANAVCFARDLENRPGNIATPSHLAKHAIEIGKSSTVDVTIYERKKFTKMGMGALAGVASGTEEPPKFIIMEYFNGPKNEKPKILVGKGLTFDSGGISIKPASKMDEMKYDMCGSGVVLGAMKAISQLKPKMNIVGIIPSTENMSGDKAYRPGDILTAYNGKTIEVLNTDAEGRLILADALAYASKHYNPEYILDFATLTGAVVVALGHIASGIMGTDSKLISSIKASSCTTGEKVWEFPLWDEYLEQVKSKIADVKNLGSPGQAGTIAGAAFLKEFVNDDIPWCHFDIAGSAWGDKKIAYQNPGSATGEIIRLVLDLLKV